MKKTILSFLLIGSAGIAIAQQPPATSSPDRSKITNNGNTDSSLNRTPSTNPNTNSSQPTNVPPTNQPTPDIKVNADSTVANQYNTATNNNVQNSAAINSGVNTTHQLNVPASIKTSFTTSYPEATTNSWYQSGDWYIARYVDNGQIKQVSYREDGKVLNAMMSPVRKSFVPDEIVNQAIQKYGASLYAIGGSKGTDGQDMYNVTLIENGQSRIEWMNTDGTTADNHFRTADDAMNVNQGNMKMQEQTDATSQDSTVNQEAVTDSSSLNHEKETRHDPKTEKDIHVMSNGLSYSKDQEGKWYVV